MLYCCRSKPMLFTNLKVSLAFIRNDFMLLFYLMIYVVAPVLGGSTSLFAEQTRLCQTTQLIPYTAALSSLPAAAKL